MTAGLLSLPVTSAIAPYDGNFDMKKTVCTVVPIVDLGLGVRWERSFKESRYCLSFSFGYDQSIYFNQNQFMNPQYDFTLASITPVVSTASEGPNFFTDRGNLTMGGFSGSIDFTF